VRGTNKADARKKENAAEAEIDKYFFDIACARSAIHKINGAQDEAGNTETSKNDTYDPFLHKRLLGWSCKPHAHAPLAGSGIGKGV
jgi:hypothetical protein